MGISASDCHVWLKLWRKMVGDKKTRVKSLEAEVSWSPLSRCRKELLSITVHLHTQHMNKFVESLRGG